MNVYKLEGWASCTQGKKTRVPFMLENGVRKSNKDRGSWFMPKRKTRSYF